MAIGFLAAPGDWYGGLEKPWFTPPNWLFGPAWTVLYVLVAVAGWRVWRAGELRAFRLWWVQLVLNFAWTPVFFGLHLTGPGFLVILALFVVILAFIAATWRAERISALLFLPYALWVAYAGLLNVSIWWLN